MRSRCQLTVERGHDNFGSVPLRLELAPNVGGAGIEAEDSAFHTLAQRLQPCVELGPPFPGRQAFDTPAQFANGDSADESSGSFCRSHATTCGSGLGLAGSLKTNGRPDGSASSWYRPDSSQGKGLGVVGIPGRHLERGRTGQQQVHQPVIRRMRDTAERDGVLILHEDLKILPCLQMHLLPHRAGQDYLAFFGENRGHV